MPFNGSGGTSQPASSVYPATASTLIESAKFNISVADIYAMLASCIVKDGQTATTARIPFASGISADTVTEKTADTGVTLDSVLLKDGRVDTSQGSDIASAATVNLETATGNLVDVTGTTTITAITLSQGHLRFVRFTGALTLTHGASLVLPGGENITTAAGDYAIFAGYASSVVRCVGYLRTGQVVGKSTAVASAGTTNIWASGTDFVHITGTTTITSLGTAPFAGAERTVVFDGALTLTHNATSLVLPGGADITTAANDRMVVRADTTANMVVTQYTPASGRSVLPSGLGSIQVFTSNGTWTKPSGLVRAKVTVVGSGAAGGGAPATGASQVSVGAAGGGGGMSVKIIAAASLGATETVTVGGGGTGVSGGSGNNGNTSSFGAHCSATGGTGGGTGGPASAAYIVGGAAGTGSSGTYNSKGDAGGQTFAQFTPEIAVPGKGGATPLGGGAVGPIKGGAGNAGGAYGGGGSGTWQGQNGAAVTGGAGADGVVIVEEFF